MLEGFVNALIRGLLTILFRIESSDLDKLPSEGPAILVSNHTTNLEGPIYYVLIQPRKATGLAKRELWGNLATRFFMQLWGMIPVTRGKPDPKAIRRALRALDRGMFLGIAPEGTRSKGRGLQRGFPGTALLATAKQVPIYPMVQWGMTDFFRNIRRLRRTPITFRVGPPFTLPPRGERRPSMAELKQMTDEMMYQLALLLPEEQRGYYAEVSLRTSRYLTFI